jgi:hypothetical protein
MPRLMLSVMTVTILTVVGCTKAHKGALATRKATTKTACELLTANEIATLLKAPAVQKDEINSGKNEMTGVDICNWYVRKNSSEGIEVRLRLAGSDDEGALALAFSAAKADAVEHDFERSQKAQPVSGVGDEAVYSAYPVGPGGSLVFRVGPNVVTLTGSASRETLVSMATIVAHRL